ncbi:MAG: hypothetical protein HYT37_01200 [Candidatus Sungbacteria bacterium]|nr:hypothetical protein [Candidatus Sungbacteria bacterium]
MNIQQLFELNIFSLPGLQNMPFMEKEKLSRTFGEEILADVASSIASELSEEKAKEFADLFDTPHTPEERTAFIQANVPNFEEIVVRETLSFKEDLAEYLKEKLGEPVMQK